RWKHHSPGSIRPRTGHRNRRMVGPTRVQSARSRATSCRRQVATSRSEGGQEPQVASRVSPQVLGEASQRRWSVSETVTFEELLDELGEDIADQLLINRPVHTDDCREPIDPRQDLKDLLATDTNQAERREDAEP